uniref:Uncharacterized protein n=2 Tax=Laticauda laticaudata TaxID=8630 RepID=A0A8C5WZ75_LATLA
KLCLLQWPQKAGRSEPLSRWEVGRRGLGRVGEWEGGRLLPTLSPPYTHTHTHPAPPCPCVCAVSPAAVPVIWLCGPLRAKGEGGNPPPKKKNQTPARVCWAQHASGGLASKAASPPRGSPQQGEKLRDRGEPVAQIQLNHSSFLSEITHYTETSRDIIMLDSSVLVAGVVIGVVLFLSCVAILIGSLRKNHCFRHLQLWSDASYTPDCFSYGGSVGELRSNCAEEFPPTFYFSSYMEALSQANIIHPDSPPRCFGD